jgi:hypothetical protein
MLWRRLKRWGFYSLLSIKKFNMRWEKLHNINNSLKQILLAKRRKRWWRQPLRNRSKHLLREISTTQATCLMRVHSTKILLSLRVSRNRQNNLLPFSYRSTLKRRLKLKKVFKLQRIPRILKLLRKMSRG